MHERSKISRTDMTRREAQPVGPDVRTPQRRRLTILGSTGSIGRSTLDVVRAMGGKERFEIVALTGQDNVALLAEQAKEFGARFVATASASKLDDLKAALGSSGIACGAGPAALIEAAEHEADIVMAGIVGIAGLAPTLAAAGRGADIALANKECLVSAGSLFIEHVRNAGGRLIPVDSEHNAIHQCLQSGGSQGLERILLTASGGPFRNCSLEEMAGMTAARAAAHPNWSMGVKISIDSASMFNKALEIIEASHLFDVGADRIEVVIHPQSIIHSMVGYRDGSVLAQLGVPDMRTAIGYALAYPLRANLPVKRLDFTTLKTLEFSAPDDVRFPALRLAREALRRGGTAGAILNGAKEAALEAFIAAEIGFLDMAVIVEDVLDAMADAGQSTSMDDVFAADIEARARAKRLIAGGWSNGARRNARA
jgi:1-deoxy-D-xylulose-5-phosphate reductoisomerase